MSIYDENNPVEQLRILTTIAEIDKTLVNIHAELGDLCSKINPILRPEIQEKAESSSESSAIKGSQVLQEVTRLYENAQRITTRIIDIKSVIDL
jgi:hypothetical protein